MHKQNVFFFFLPLPLPFLLLILVGVRRNNVKKKKKKQLAKSKKKKNFLLFFTRCSVSISIQFQINFTSVQFNSVQSRPTTKNRSKRIFKKAARLEQKNGAASGTSFHSYTFSSKSYRNPVITLNRAIGREIAFAPPLEIRSPHDGGRTHVRPEAQAARGEQTALFLSMPTQHSRVQKNA